ncbi:MAG: DUF4965 domain-containing protein, partial [Mucilaginibacter sp.]
MKLNKLYTTILCAWICLVFAGRVSAQMTKTSAYPLITHNPYFSIWSPTDELHGSTTTHWSGSKQAITGMIDVDGKIYSFLGTPVVSNYTNILPAADESSWSGRYTFTTPATGWQNAAFNDNAWSVGKAVFSSNDTKETLWNTPDIWVRRKFTLTTANRHRLLLKLYHDDNVQVYLNGVQINASTGYNSTYDYFFVPNNLVVGDNVLAVHCQNAFGGAELDFGLIDAEAVLLPASDEIAWSSLYTFTAPPAGWQSVGFNDTAWPVNKAFFSSNAAKGTLWNTPDIWVRRKFKMNAANTHKLLLKLYHDDNVEVYLNGVQVYANAGYNATYDYFTVPNNLVQGDNVLAVHCHNTFGGADLDFGLIDADALPSGNATVTKAVQNSVSVAATQTHYNFTCGTVNLNVSFLSPLFLDDLTVLGRPVSYIKYTVKATDNLTHNVKVYLGVSGDLAATRQDDILTASQFTYKDLAILKTGTTTQPVLQGRPETINWGYLYVAVPTTYGASQMVTSPLKINPFTVTNRSTELMQGNKLILNTVIPFGNVNGTAVEKHIEIGYENPFPIQFFSQNLRPWWNSDGTRSMNEELYQGNLAYTGLVQKANTLDAKVYNDAVAAGGENYAKMCALAYRQSIAAHELVKSPGGEILFLSKENSSGGFASTVDVSYPSCPMYLIYNPKLVEGMMNGIFYYCESNKFTDPFAPHDIGFYPKANGQTYFLPMPIEETGNMILMVAAMEKALGNVDYARKHWPMLTKWVNYLVGIGYDPPSQLTSDDFAGTIAHNANLSAKLINAIAAYAELARNMGDQTTYQNYYDKAKNMVPQWISAAEAGDHYKLAFDQPNTWSQKYNIIWDKLLGLNL